jgi:hypothetical protein
MTLTPVYSLEAVSVESASDAPIAYIVEEVFIIIRIDGI